MEALVAIFAEIVIACMMPVISLLGALIGAIFEGILLLFGGVFSEYVEKRRKRRTAAVNRPQAPGKPLIPRKAVHWVAGTCAVIGLAGIAASYVFFQPILRHVMDVAGDKAGMQITYTQASGSLLGGHVVLEGLALSRTHTTGLAFDLQIDRAEADVAVTSLLGEVPTLVLGQVNSVTGTITPPLPKEDVKGLPKERRAFRADLFAIEDVSVQVTPRDAEPFDVVIEQAKVAPFRSGLAVFDLLFRSNMRAEIAGQTLVVETREVTENGRETHWAFENIDAAQLKRILPKAPLTWVEDGRVTVAVSDKWSLSDNVVDMDWRIASSGLRTSSPEGAGPAERVLAGGLRRYVDRFGGDVDFQYRLTLDPDEMAQLRQGDLDAFWQKVLSGIVKGGVTQDVPANQRNAPDKPGALDKVRSFFKRGGADE